MVPQVKGRAGRSRQGLVDMFSRISFPDVAMRMFLFKKALHGNEYFFFSI
jgi:hypothetical protein